VKLPISSEPASSGNMVRTVASEVRLAPFRAATRPAVKLDPEPDMSMPVDEAEAIEDIADIDESWAIATAARPARVRAYFMLTVVARVVLYR
jgi:hypothetical protein